VDGKKAIVFHRYTKTLYDLLYKNNENLHSASKYAIALLIAKGLKHVHKKNVLHGSLAIRNIVLDSQCNPILTNFGTKQTSTIQEKLKDPRRDMLFYYSPECNATISNDFSIDTYAFGIILYEIIFQRKPFDNLEEFMESIMNHKFPIHDYPVSSDLTNLKAIMIECIRPVSQRPPMSDICKKIKISWKSIQRGFISDLKKAEDTLDPIERKVTFMLKFLNRQKEILEAQRISIGSNRITPTNSGYLQFLQKKTYSVCNDQPMLDEISNFFTMRPMDERNKRLFEFCSFSTRSQFDLSNCEIEKSQMELICKVLEKNVYLTSLNLASMCTVCNF
jgi:serine/threonine protein kinase